MTQAITSGPYAPVFWAAVGLFVLALASLVWQAVNRSWSIGWLVAAGVAVNVAALGKRYLIVLPSQTHGTLLPYPHGTPGKMKEYGVGIGLFSLGALAIAIFMKFFPVVPLARKEATTDA